MGAGVGATDADAAGGLAAAAAASGETFVWCGAPQATRAPIDSVAAARVSMGGLGLVVMRVFLLSGHDACGAVIHSIFVRREAVERRLLRRLSDDELGQTRWLDVCFPNKWHYDVVRVLDYLRTARDAPDERMSEALAIVESKHDADGRWPLDRAYHPKLLVDLGETEGRPSRWITLRAPRAALGIGMVDAR